MGRNLDEPRDDLGIAKLYTRQTSVKIPASVIIAGHRYYLWIRATRNGWTFASPPMPNETLFRTEVFSPMFTASGG